MATSFVTATEIKQKEKSHGNFRGWSCYKKHFGHKTPSDRAIKLMELRISKAKNKQAA